MTQGGCCNVSNGVLRYASALDIGAVAHYIECCVWDTTATAAETERTVCSGFGICWQPFPTHHDQARLAPAGMTAQFVVSHKLSTMNARSTECRFWQMLWKTQGVITADILNHCRGEGLHVRGLLRRRCVTWKGMMCLMSKHPDVLVIGRRRDRPDHGVLSGRSVERFCSGRVDKGGAWGHEASWAGAGILHAGRHPPRPHALRVPQGCLDRQTYPALSQPG